MKNPKQTKDKQRIYNSREWRLLRDQKRRANPLCELCLANGKVVPTQAIHHKIPIETAQSFDEMKRLAFRYDNLQSLCYKCHSEIHQAMKSHTKEGHQKAADAALQRWISRHSKENNI